MNILIIGDGSAGHRHARMLRERGHVCVVVGPESASPVTHPDCEAVVIASPPLTHKLYLSWYYTKCPILCEGPVTWCPETHWPDFPHMVASNWLFVPQVVNLYALVQAKGYPVTAHLWLDYDLARWRPDVDYRVTCYYTDGIDHINLHELITAFHLFGVPASVQVEYARTGKSLGVDAVGLLIRHCGGTLTTITSSWHSASYQRGIRVTWPDGTGHEIGWASPQDDDICNRSYGDMLDHWLGAIERRDLTVRPSLLDGYRAWKAVQGVAL